MAGNGNGLSKSNGNRGDLPGLPPWMAMMRQAAIGQIKEEDVAAIMKNQIEAAKNGNKDAIKFVFDYCLGGNLTKGATFIQNNNYGSNGAAEATGARPGTDAKIDAMRRRAEAGLPLQANGDGGEMDLS